MGKRAPVLFATVVACLSLVGVVAAQSGAPRPTTDFGHSIASYFDEREYGELAELFMTHEDTCPLSTPGGLLPICEGVAEGETVNGYIVAQMGSDASLATRETLIEGLEFLHDQAYEGRDGWRLFTVGLDGVPYGYTACDGCEVVVISRTDLAETTGELIMFQVMEVDGELRIWSMTNGSTGVTGSQALLKGGPFENSSGWKTTFVEVGAPIDAGTGQQPTPIAPTVGTGYDDHPAAYAPGVLAMGTILGLAVGGTVLAARARNRPL